MNKYQNGFVLIPILIIVLVLIIIGYGYRVSTSPDRSTPTLTSTLNSVSQNIEDIDQWKTFTNYKYGWSLKYPANWYIYDKGYRYIDSDNKVQFYSRLDELLIAPKPFPEYIDEGTEFPFSGLRVRFDPTNLDLQEISDQVGNFKATQIDGRDGIIVSRESPRTYDGRKEGTVYYTTYYIDYPKDKFKILTISSNYMNGEEELSDINNEIMSSLEFVNTLD